jgi:hypothetical protein
MSIHLLDESKFFRRERRSSPGSARPAEYKCSALLFTTGNWPDRLCTSIPGIRENLLIWILQA